MSFALNVREIHPHARRVLLVRRGEWKNEHPAVEAMRTGQADAYVFVPWGLPERWLYLPMTELLADWEASQRPPTEVVQIVGEERERRAHELRDVFAHIGIPFGFYSPTSPEARPSSSGHSRRLRGCRSSRSRSGTVLVDPSYERIVQALGFSTEPEAPRCDLAIVGGGPAGLAAAVYGASEGLTTVLIDHAIPGGQAGTSSRIRNYLGFPTGLSGRDLTNRALEQAWFFGARFVLSRRATALAPTGYGYRIDLEDARGIEAESLSSAPASHGAASRSPSIDALLGAGVFYGAARPTPRRSRGRGCSSSAPGTQPGRRRCISPQREQTSRSSCAAEPAREHVRLPRPRARGNTRDRDQARTPRWSAPAAEPTSRASRSATTDHARPKECLPTCST